MKPSPELIKAFQPVLEWLDAGGDTPDMHFNIEFDIKKASEQSPIPDHAGVKHTCGTAACIGGALKIFNETKCIGILGSACELGMSFVDANDMFFGYTLDDATPAHAASVIRHWIETGKVKWK